MKIVFGYQMGVGKDTACEYLKSKYGGNIISLSKPLYDIMDYAQSRCKLPNHKDRQFLQMVGTEWLETKYSGRLAQIALNDISMLSPETNIYISDLRLVNQFHILRNNGFIAVKINRPRNEIFLSERTGSGSTKHRSEIELDSIHNDQWDIIINNDGDLKHFFLQLDQIISFNK